MTQVTLDAVMQGDGGASDDRRNGFERGGWTGGRATNDRLHAEGHWVFVGGLASSDTATVIDNRGGTAMVTDGPFLESKEHLGGFWVIEAPDPSVALTLATEGSTRCNRRVEVRPFV